MKISMYTFLFEIDSKFYAAEFNLQMQQNSD